MVSKEEAVADIEEIVDSFARHTTHETQVFAYHAQAMGSLMKIFLHASQDPNTVLQYSTVMEIAMRSLAGGLGLTESQIQEALKFADTIDQRLGKHKEVLYGKG